MKKILSIVSVFFTLLILTGCGAAKLSPQKQALIDNKTALYTQVTMWSDKGKIIGTNYSVSSIVPINSKVQVLSVSSSNITFEMNGQKLTYDITTKYTKLDVTQMLDRLFNTTAIDLSQYQNRSNIEQGIVARGMSKEEVLLARGYPPAHETLSTKKDTWKYWRNRWTTGTVTFKDNVVSRSSVF